MNHNIQAYREKAKAPLLINSCETDPQLPKEAQAQADEVLGGGKFKPGYERTYWEGCTHGFAVRGDLVRAPMLLLSSRYCILILLGQSDPKVKAGKEGAFEATVKFYKKHL